MCASGHADKVGNGSRSPAPHRLKVSNLPLLIIIENSLLDTSSYIICIKVLRYQRFRAEEYFTTSTAQTGAQYDRLSHSTHHQGCHSTHQLARTPPQSSTAADRTPCHAYLIQAGQLLHGVDCFLAARARIHLQVYHSLLA